MATFGKRYERVRLESFFDVSHIVEISYRGFPRDCVIDYTKAVDFWCLYYVDRGKALLKMNDNETCELTSGKGMFFAPGSSFERITSGKDGVNILSVFFCCDNLPAESYDLHLRNFDTFERMILSELVNIGHVYFERHSNEAKGIKGTKPKEGSPDYIPHFVKASIEFLLLRLYKDKKDKKFSDKPSSGQTNLMVKSAVEYMYRNVGKKLKVSDIADSVKMSESNFQAVFKKATGQSVMNYFNFLKVEQAKIMIRKETYTYSEIALALGFSSESYFSRHFKKIAGMTPSEYAKLVYFG